MPTQNLVTSAGVSARLFVMFFHQISTIEFVKIQGVYVVSKLVVEFVTSLNYKPPYDFWTIICDSDHTGFVQKTVFWYFLQCHMKLWISKQLRQLRSCKKLANTWSNKRLQGDSNMYVGTFFLMMQLKLRCLHFTGQLQQPKS